MSETPLIPLDIAIDVSDAQGMQIDWKAVYAEGIRIAFIKATEGDTFVAKSFERNRSAAALAGLVVIPYHYLRPVPADRQASHFYQVAALEEGTLFALDWEGRASQTCSASQAQAMGDGLAAITNRKPLGYWGLPGATPAAPTAAMQDWYRWVPRYPQVGVNSWDALNAGVRGNPAHYWYVDKNNTLPRFAQYTSWGRVRGITGPVDRSVAFFSSVEEAVAWVAGKTPDAPAAPVQQTPQIAKSVGKPIPATPVAATPAHHSTAPRSAADDSDELLNQAELDRLRGG